MTWLTSIIKPSPNAMTDAEMRRDASAWMYDTTSGGTQTTSGTVVNQDTMLTLSAVYAAARAISEDVAAMPLKVFRRLDGGGKEVADADPTWHSPQLVRSVNLHTLVHRHSSADMTNLAYRSLLIWWATLYGNGYAQINRDAAGNPTAFTPIHPHLVTVKHDKVVGVWYDIREDRVGGVRRELFPEDVLHIKGPSDNGIVGDMIDKRAAESFGVYLAAEKHTGAFFGRGATLAGLISFDQQFKTKESRQVYRDEFNRHYSGSANAGKWMIADNGAKLTPFSVDPEKSQLLDTLKFRIEDVARWFRVPPVIIGHNTSTPYANIQPLGQFYYNFGLKPWAIRVEQEYDRKLVRDDAFFIEHVVDSLMWADPKTRTEVHAMRIRSGMETPNEARSVENLNPYEGGDKFRVEQNLAVIDDEGNPVRANEPSAAATAIPTGNDVDAGAVRVAMMPVFVDAAERMISRESKAYKAKRHPDDTWLDAFYIGHRSAIVSMMRPHIAATAKLIGSSSDQSEILERYADLHVAESRRRLRDGENPEEWLKARPAWIAKFLTDEVL